MFNKINLLTFSSLLLLVITLPVYLWIEPQRLEQAQVELRQQFVSDAAVMYIESCALCHGAAGEGIGATPPLASDTLRQADYDSLYKTIARGRYGTVMSSWHQDEGGLYNDYQVQELVTLIRYGDWSQLRELAAQQGLLPPTMPAAEVDPAFLEQVIAMGADGNQWVLGLQIFADNCTVCHGIDGMGSDLGVALNTLDVRSKEAEELMRIISLGQPGTAMVGWNTILSGEDIANVVSFLQNWDVLEGQGLEMKMPEPIRIDVNNPEERLALGDRLYSTTCIACHGEDGSGGTGPALNSQQILGKLSDDQIRATIVNGGSRPNSTMPAFGDRLTSIEIDSLVEFIRAWEPDAPWVANPRGTSQGGGPPWLRATPDPENPIDPQQGSSVNRGRGRGPTWQQQVESTQPVTP